jgi:hypothetical protein
MQACLAPLLVPALWSKNRACAWGGLPPSMCGTWCLITTLFGRLVSGQDVTMFNTHIPFPVLCNQASGVPDAWFTIRFEQSVTCPLLLCLPAGAQRDLGHMATRSGGGHGARGQQFSGQCILGGRAAGWSAARQVRYRSRGHLWCCRVQACSCGTCGAAEVHTCCRRLLQQGVRDYDNHATSCKQLCWSWSLVDVT